MKTILVITSSRDSIVDYIISIYSHKCFFFRLDLDRMYDYNFQLNQYGWSIDNYREFVTDKTVDAIYDRKPSYPDFTKYDRQFQKLMKGNMDTIIKGITSSFEGKRLNNLYIKEIAQNTIYQMYLAHKVGFIIPESLVTNSTKCMDKFCAEKKRILKPLLIETESFVNCLNSNRCDFIEDTKLLEGLEISPAYLQSFVKKDYEVIVTLFCEKFFVARVDVENKKNIRGEDKNIYYLNMTLPKEIEKKCIDFMKELKLEFGVFKFIVRNNDYFFLGVNPNFEWLTLENQLGWDLSSEIVEYLCS